MTVYMYKVKSKNRLIPEWHFNSMKKESVMIKVF